MKNAYALRSLAMTGLLSAMFVAGCSKSPTETVAKAAEPDNAVTRYGQNLSQSEQRAQEVANRANAAIARQQDQLNQGQAGSNP